MAVRIVTLQLLSLTHNNPHHLIHCPMLVLVGMMTSLLGVSTTLEVAEVVMKVVVVALIAVVHLQILMAQLRTLTNIHTTVHVIIIIMYFSFCSSVAFSGLPSLT